MREADKWVELYEHHDKYKLIGQLRDPQPAELAVDEAEAEQLAAEAARWEAEQVERAAHAEGSKKHRPFKPR